MQYEIGVVTAHPIVAAWKSVLSILRTWAYCRKHGIQTRKWYAVYEAGTEHVVAHFGNMPQAFHNANLFKDALIEWGKNNGSAAQQPEHEGENE